MIELIAIGNADKAILETLRRPLEEVFAQGTRIGNRMPLSQEPYYHSRRQYLASVLLSLIALPDPGDRVLAVIDVDLFTPGLNFVFGMADTAGGRALISLLRLRQEFYGLPQDKNLFRERVLKEAVHELGHTYGLGHCPDPICVMHVSNSLHDTDLKGWSFCRVCQVKISQKCNRLS